MSKLSISIAFRVGETVYCVHDPEQSEMQVSGIYITYENVIMYECKKTSSLGFFYASELSDTKTVF
jgi:hypothetical protein